jgi:aminopeptidase N
MKEAFLEENKIEIENEVSCTVFGVSAPISTYLYSIMAGPYACIECPYKFKIPMRLFCRKSILEHT